MLIWLSNPYITNQITKIIFPTKGSDESCVLNHQKKEDVIKNIEDKKN